MFAKSMQFKSFGVAALMAIVVFSQRATARADDKVFRRTLLSTVFIVSVLEPAKGSSKPAGVSTGTGWVLDYRNGYLVTNEHVIRGAKEVRVYFPHFVGGEVIRSPKYYVSKTRPAIAKVAAQDAFRDLAVIKIDSLPSHMRALPLAKGGVSKGDEVFSIGNQADVDMLWINRKGRVLHRGFSVVAEEVSKRMVGEMIFTRSEFVKGNSGGPIVNKNGELVGVVAAISGHKRFNVNVGLGELRRYLNVLPPIDFKPTRRDPLNGRWIAHIKQGGVEFPAGVECSMGYLSIVTADGVDGRQYRFTQPPTSLGPKLEMNKSGKPTDWKETFYTSLGDVQFTIHMEGTRISLTRPFLFPGPRFVNLQTGDKRPLPGPGELPGPGGSGVITPRGYSVGQTVFAHWPSDGYWYQATIKQVRGDRYLVRFTYDGVARWVSRSELYHDSIGAGDPVQADWLGRGTFYSGRVTARRGNQVWIHYHDGSREATVASRVRLRLARG